MIAPPAANHGAVVDRAGLRLYGVCRARARVLRLGAAGRRAADRADRRAHAGRHHWRDVVLQVGQPRRHTDRVGTLEKRSRLVSLLRRIWPTCWLRKV